MVGTRRRVDRCGVQQPVAPHPDPIVGSWQVGHQVVVLASITALAEKSQRGGDGAGAVGGAGEVCTALEAESTRITEAVAGLREIAAEIRSNADRRADARAAAVASWDSSSTQRS